MSPVLRDGDLLGARAPHPDEPRPGQIVVARDFVKRAAMVTATDVVLAGDNAAASTDPPPLSRTEVTGVVRFRYWPPWRARLFP